MLTKSTKLFILGYSVIVNMLLSSAPGKAYLSVCSVTLLAFPKLEARGLIEEWRKSIIGGEVFLCITVPLSKYQGLLD